MAADSSKYPSVLSHIQYADAHSRGPRSEPAAADSVPRVTASVTSSNPVPQLMSYPSAPAGYPMTHGAPTVTSTSYSFSQPMTAPMAATAAFLPQPIVRPLTTTDPMLAMVQQVQAQQAQTAQQMAQMLQAQQAHAAVASQHMVQAAFAQQAQVSQQMVQSLGAMTSLGGLGGGAGNPFGMGGLDPTGGLGGLGGFDPSGGLGGFGGMDPTGGLGGFGGF